MGEQLVTAWCWQFLGRAPSPQDKLNGDSIDAGLLTPAGVLAGTVACDECWYHNGGNVAAWFNMLLTQIAHLPMTGANLASWEAVLWRNGGPTYAGRLPTAENFIATYSGLLAAKSATAPPTDVASQRATTATNLDRLLGLPRLFLSQADRNEVYKQQAYWQQATDADVAKLLSLTPP